MKLPAHTWCFELRYYMFLECYLPLTETEMLLLSLPIGLVTVHVYVPLSLVVKLLIV